MDSPSADVVIVGGGGIGSSIAYFLTRYSPGLKVVVCERDPTYAHASTCLAAGGIRQMFSTPENIRMSQFSFSFIEQAHETLAVGDSAPEMGLKHENYLRLLPEERREEVRAQVDLQRSLGAGSHILEPGELKALFPG